MNKYYDFVQIIEKIEKIYTKGTLFKSFISGENIFPLTFSVKKITQKDIQQDFTLIQNAINILKKNHLPIVYKEFDFKLIGKQLLPSCIYFECLDDFLKVIKKEDEYHIFVKNYLVLTSKYPKLKEFFLEKPFLVLENDKSWTKIILVVNFLLKNTHPNIYIRELCIQGIDTKFVEKNKKIIDLLLSCIQGIYPLKQLVDYAFEKKYNLKYPLPQVRFRILDEKLKVGGLEDITIDIKEFEKLNLACKKVFIIENKITTLSFPKLKDSIVIFGSGYKVGVLKNANWLRNKEIFYWGDIDVDGFAILSQARGYFKQIQSICMDIKTIEKFSDLKVCSKKRLKKEKLLYLTDEEKGLYENLENDFRLEQERISFDFLALHIN